MKYVVGDEERNEVLRNENNVESKSTTSTSDTESESNEVGNHVMESIGNLDQMNFNVVGNQRTPMQWMNPMMMMYGCYPIVGMLAPNVNMMSQFGYGMPGPVECPGSSANYAMQLQMMQQQMAAFMPMGMCGGGQIQNQVSQQQQNLPWNAGTWHQHSIMAAMLSNQNAQLVTHNSRRNKNVAPFENEAAKAELKSKRKRRRDELKLKLKKKALKKLKYINFFDFDDGTTLDESDEVTKDDTADTTTERSAVATKPLRLPLLIIPDSTSSSNRPAATESVLEVARLACASDAAESVQSGVETSLNRNASH